MVGVLLGVQGTPAYARIPSRIPMGDPPAASTPSAKISPAMPCTVGNVASPAPMDWFAAQAAALTSSMILCIVGIASTGVPNTKNVCLACVVIDPILSLQILEIGWNP